MIYYSSKIGIYCCLLYLHYLILQAKENDKKVHNYGTI